MNRVSVAVEYNQKWQAFRIPYTPSTTYDELIQQAYQVFFHMHRQQVDASKMGKVHVFL